MTDKMWQESFAEVVKRLTGYDVPKTMEEWRTTPWEQVFPNWNDLPPEKQHWINTSMMSANWIADYQYVVQSIMEQTGLSQTDAMIFYFGMQARQVNANVQFVSRPPKEPWEE